MLNTKLHLPSITSVKSPVWYCICSKRPPVLPAPDSRHGQPSSGRSASTDNTLQQSPPVPSVVFHLPPPLSGAFPLAPYAEMPWAALAVPSERTLLSFSPSAKEEKLEKQHQGIWAFPKRGLSLEVSICIWGKPADLDQVLLNTSEQLLVLHWGREKSGLSCKWKTSVHGTVKTTSSTLEVLSIQKA